MPKSKVRKKTEYTISPATRAPIRGKVGQSSTWYVVLMITIALLGLLWLGTFYLAADPMNLGAIGEPLHWMVSLGAWNFLIGFSFFVVALVMTMWWR